MGGNALINVIINKSSFMCGFKFTNFLYSFLSKSEVKNSNFDGENNYFELNRLITQ